MGDSRHSCKPFHLWELPRWHSHTPLVNPYQHGLFAPWRLWPMSELYVKEPDIVERGYDPIIINALNNSCDKTLFLTALALLGDFVSSRVETGQSQKSCSVCQGQKTMTEAWSHCVTIWKWMMAKPHKQGLWLANSGLELKDNCLSSSEGDLRPLLISFSLPGPGTASENNSPWTSWRWPWPWPCCVLSCWQIPPKSLSPSQDLSWSPRMGFIYVSGGSTNPDGDKIGSESLCQASCLPVSFRVSCPLLTSCFPTDHLPLFQLPANWPSVLQSTSPSLTFL